MSRAYFWHLVRGLVYVHVLVAVIIAGITLDPGKILTRGLGWAFSGIESLHGACKFRLSEKVGETVLSQSSAVLATPSPFAPRGAYSVLQVFFAGPQDMLFSHIQAMARVQGSGLPEAVTEPPLNEDVEVSRNESGARYETGDPEAVPNLKGIKVAFYCTHNGESYRPDCGQSRMEGEQGHVNLVAAALQKETAKRGFTSFHITTVHDYPDFASSYSKSRETVQALLRQHPDIAAIFDVHRDAYPQAQPDSIEIGGRSAARILIVVGTDERKPHPNWKQNAEFARLIYERGEAMYPGLLKQIRFKSGTYNQEFHPRALLVEFGNDENSLSEALYSAQLFAEILSQVFAEGER